MCSFLQCDSAAEQLSVDECGAIGSFIADEIQLHAVELSNAHIVDFQQHMDGLLIYVQNEGTSEAAVEQIIRFLRGHQPASLRTLRGCCARLSRQWLLTFVDMIGCVCGVCQHWARVRTRCLWFYPPQ